MPKLKPGTILPTEKEDKVITQQAREDDTLLTDEQLAEMKPISEFPQLQTLAKRGRPAKSNPKKSTTIRLNADVLNFFKAQGKGWQTRINNILQDYIDSHHAA
jgi:uncharacterized protein (DUF4415 family)